MKKIKIKNIEIENPVLLAPMEKVTDVPFRSICRKLGADIVYTEFINTSQINNDFHRLDYKIKLWDRERPVGIQIYSHNIKSLVEAAKKVAKLEPDIIDLNFGCWVEGVVRKNAGAAMLQYPEKMIDMAKATVDAVDIPVTLKTRIGWDSKSMIIHELAPKLEEVGIQLLTLHCRTREQGLKGNADWNWITKTKQNINIPLILNGDIKNEQDAVNAMNVEGADGIMIGRAAVGDPFIFKRVKAVLKGEQIPQISIKERFDICLEHLKFNIEYRGKNGLQEFRKHYSGYLHGFQGSKEMHKKLVRLESYSEVETTLYEYQNFLTENNFLEQQIIDLSQERIYSRKSLI